MKLLFLLFGLAAAQFPSTCPPAPSDGNGTVGICPGDFAVVGPTLEPVHESTNPTTGLAVDPSLNIYLMYPRNTGPTPINVVIVTSFTDEVPWPNAEIQNCTEGQNIAECFVNIQNVVLDSINQLWVVDSGILPGMKSAVTNGSKIMSFDLKGNHLRTYTVPDSFFYGEFNANDVRINNTLGKNGHAFITDESNAGSVAAINLDDGSVTKRVFNNSVTRADENYVGVYDGELIYGWNGTKKSFLTTGADGIALASGNVYWSVLASRRFYFISQETLIDTSLSDEQMLTAVQDPGMCGSEQAGLTADDKGRVYIMASEHNTIFYVDTQQSAVTMEVNGVPAGGSGPGAVDNYVVKDFVRSGLIQHADSAAILDGWMYFCTNQLAFSPGRQYNNVDNRRGPFRSYRAWTGTGPAV